MSNWICKRLYTKQYNNMPQFSISKFLLVPRHHSQSLTHAQPDHQRRYHHHPLHWRLWKQVHTSYLLATRVRKELQSCTLPCQKLDGRGPSTKIILVELPYVLVPSLVLRSKATAVLDNDLTVTVARCSDTFSETSLTSP